MTSSQWELDHLRHRDIALFRLEPIPGLVAIPPPEHVDLFGTTLHHQQCRRAVGIDSGAT